MHITASKEMCCLTLLYLLVPEQRNGPVPQRYEPGTLSTFSLATRMGAFNLPHTTSFYPLMLFVKGVWHRSISGTS